MSLSETELAQHIAAIGNSDWGALMRVLERGFHREPIVVTDDATLTVKEHGGRTVVVNKAAGADIVLPPATGSGVKIKVVVGTTISSNTMTISAGADSFQGVAFGVDTDAEGATGYTWNADANDDTITMSGTATGGVAGDVWEFEDYAADLWLVTGRITQSGGSEATPFSAA